MDALKDKMQSTKVVIACLIFATATGLLVAALVTASVWESVAQTVLWGYCLSDVAAKFAPKAAA